MRTAGCWATAIVAGLLGLTGDAVGGYFVTDLGVLPGGHASYGAAINANGQVAGTAAIDPFREVAVSGGGGSLTPLGNLPGGSGSVGRGINSNGFIAGQADVAVDNGRGGTQLRTHAFRSIGGGSLEDLGTFENDSHSAAFAINGGGHVAGSSTRGDGSLRAVIGLGKDSYTDLGSLGGGNGIALGLNGNDVATGWSTLASGARQAFRSTANGMQDLGTLAGFSSSEGRGINESGDVTGFAGSFGSARAFLAIGNAPPTLLGALPFGMSSEALGLNDRRVVVGQTDYAAGPSHAFVWDPVTARMYDLNDLISFSFGGLITSAAGINNAGQIVGTALIGGQFHAVLLTPDRTPFLPIGTPVPEPGSWALLLLGGGLLATRRFRRGRRVVPVADGPVAASPAR